MKHQPSLCVILITLSMLVSLAGCKPAPPPSKETTGAPIAVRPTRTPGSTPGQAAPRPPQTATATAAPIVPLATPQAGMQLTLFDTTGDLVDGWYWLRDAELVDYAQWKLINIPPGEEDIVVDVNALATDRAGGGRGFDARFSLSLGRDRNVGLDVTLPNVSEPRDTPGYSCHGTVTIPRATLLGASEILITARRLSAVDSHVAFKSDSLLNPRLAASCGQVTDFQSNGDLIQGWYWLRDEALEQVAQWSITGIPEGTADLVLDLEALATDTTNGAGGFDAHFLLSFGDDAQYTMPVALANVSASNDPVGYSCRGSVTIPREALGGGSRLHLVARRASAAQVHVAFNAQSISRVRTLCPISTCAEAGAGEGVGSGRGSTSGQVAAAPPQPEPYYLAMEPQPDADKEGVQGSGEAAPEDNSCWLATAANLLACAGYGEGRDIQRRSDSIYDQMVDRFGTGHGGWADTAVTWWLGSEHNTLVGTNPYTLVTVYGAKSPRVPWADPNGPRFVANELRSGLCVGLSISWPTDALSGEGQPGGQKPGQGQDLGKVGSGGHAITAWGDSGRDASPLDGNPELVLVADSDRDTGGDIQVYKYDVYTDPNPVGANEGFGWYIDYDPNHPYIDNVVTLAPTDDPSSDVLTLRVTGSYRIRQAAEQGASIVAYEVATDAEILGYLATLDWTGSGPTGMSSPSGRSREAKWDLSDNPVPQGEWVAITSELVLPALNAIGQTWVMFAFPDGSEAEAAPSLQWRIETPPIEGTEAIPDVSGGYVVAAFDVLDPNGEAVAQYRLVHQYAYNQSPEKHTFTLTGRAEYSVAKLRFGLSYGYLRPDELWQFEDWLTELPYTFRLGEETTIDLDWTGKVPYPLGEDVTRRIETIEEGLQR